MPKKTKKKPAAPSKLVAYACRFGAMGAIVPNRFEETLDGLDDDDRQMLFNGFASTVELANGDAGREIRMIRQCLERLRDELKEKDK